MQVYEIFANHKRQAVFRQPGEFADPLVRPDGSVAGHEAHKHSACIQVAGSCIIHGIGPDRKVHNAVVIKISNGYDRTSKAGEVLQGS